MPRKKAKSKPVASLDGLLGDVVREREAAKPANSIEPPTVESFLQRWRVENGLEAPSGEVVPFPADNPLDVQALAARSGKELSAETRERLAKLVRKLRDEPKAP